MEDEDFRSMTLNQVDLKVFRDGRIHSYDKFRKKWVDRKFRTRPDEYFDFGLGSHRLGTYKGYTVHSVISLCYLGEKPEGLQTDHINNIRTDNRVENLQYISLIDNARKRLDYKFKQPIKGFSINKYGRFRARLRHYGKFIDLGTHTTEAEARKAYCDAKMKYHNVKFEN